MKVRSGFVSNSSSASFVIRWKHHEDRSVNSALAWLFDAHDDKTDSFNWNHMEKQRSVLEEIASNTEKVGKGEYESSFFTAMMNSPMDFGIAAGTLSLALMCNDGKGFDIVSFKVEDA